MRGLILLVAANLVACAGGATGDVVLLLDADPTIRDGLEAGDGRGEVRDGWSVHFDKFIVGVGDVEIARDESGAALLDPKVRVFDLTNVSQAIELHRFDGVDAVRWHNVSYRTPVIDENAIVHESASEADVRFMREEGWTHLIEGRVTHDDGLSCPPGQECRPANQVRFRLGARAPALFSFCANDFGVTGVAVPAGATAIVGLSLNGDHIFLNAFLTGHANLARLAQWVADADLNGDDLVTEEELATVPASEVMPTPPQGTYSFAGSPRPIVTALDFVTGQLATLGHFQGTGECAWELED